MPVAINMFLQQVLENSETRDNMKRLQTIKLQFLRVLAPLR